VVIGGREDQAELLAAAKQSIGEQLAQQERGSHLVGAAVVHAHHAVHGREVRLDDELEGVADGGVAACARGHVESGVLAHRAQRERYVVTAQRPRVLEAGADGFELVEEAAAVALDDDAADLGFVDVDTQHTLRRERVVDGHFGFDEAVAHVHGGDGLGHRARAVTREWLTEGAAVGGEELRRLVGARALDHHRGEHRQGS
jgi:hypothetical protein